MRTQSSIFRTSRLLLVGFIGVLIMALAACGSNGGNGGGGDDDDDGFPEPPGRPGFASSVTGAWDAAWSGSALHGLDLADEASFGGFAVRLEDAAAGDQEPAILLLSEREGAPSRGVYPIAAHPGAGDFGAFVTLPGQAARLPATSGTLTITRRAGDVLDGRFRFEVENAEGQPITVTGKFSSIARQ